MKKFIAILIAISIICTPIALYCTKTPIKYANTKQLEKVHGISEILAEDIVLYFRSNPKSEIGDLIEVKYIGNVRLKELKKAFR